MTFILALLFYCTFLSLWTSVVNSCSTGHFKNSKDACCVNFVKEKKFCKECPIGYIGINCTVPCDQPFYGNLCSLRCECLKCHHIYDCVTDNTMSEPNVTTRALQNLRNLKIDQTTELKTIQRQGKQPKIMNNSAEMTNLIIISTGVVLTVVLLTLISFTYCKRFTSANINGNNPDSQNIQEMDTVYAEIIRRRI